MTTNLKLPFFKKGVMVILVFVALIFFAEDTLLVLNRSNKQKPIIGLKLYGKSISRLSRPDLGQFISKLRPANKLLRLKSKDQLFVVRGNEIGASFNLPLVTDALLAEGRGGNFISNILKQNQAFLRLDSKKIRATLDKSAMLKLITQIGNQVNQSPTPIRPDFAHDISKTLPAQDGIALDPNRLADVIANNILNPPKSALTIPLLTVSPSVHQNRELDSIRQTALNLTEDSIKISSGDQIFTLARQDLLNLLTVKERPNPKNAKQLILVSRLDEDKLNKKLGEFARQVETATNAEFDDHDARVAIYSQFYSGTRNLLKIPTGNNPVALQNLEKRKRATQSQSGNLNQLASVYAASADTPTDGQKFVYLTFDDGPNDIYHPMILDILKQYNVKATFFLVGQNSQRYSEITKRTVAEGHVIGDHSLTHAFLPKLASGEILKEIKTTKEILKSFNNDQDITLFRPPYGGVNPSVKKDAANLNLKLTLWSVDPRDWSEPEVNDLVDRVIANTRSRSDILLHSNHSVTVKALPKIIEQLQAQGYTFELLN